MISIRDAFLSQMEQIEDFRNRKYLLMISGGVDSMVLLNLFLKHIKSQNLEVLHLNYKMRGTESDAQADLVFKISQAANIKIYNITNKIDKNSGNIQAEARKIRFNEVEKLFTESHFDYCVTAHHADDQLETFLFRLFRGTGISGATSFDFHNEERRIIRPLLLSGKNDILNFAKDNDIDYIEDSSNLSDFYMRNWLRNVLYPQLEERFYGCKEKVINFMTEIKKCSNFITASAKNCIDIENDGNGNIIFDRKNFIELHEVLQTEIIRNLYKEATGSFSGLSREIIFNCCIMIRDSTNPQASIDLPGNLILARDYGKIKFCMNYESDDIDSNCIYEQLQIDKVTKIRDFEILVTRVEKGKYYPGKNCFPESSLVFPLCIRTRKDGDRVNGKSMRKLKRIFIDRKIQRKKRDQLILVTDAEKVLWSEKIGYFHPREKSDDTHFFKIEIKKSNYIGI
ncbi:tRNA lysidine(34) synthetase TilS [bacterium]|nr:tRNA lysidine(34) synthetase TilS [bacterium]